MRNKKHTWGRTPSDRLILDNVQENESNLDKSVKEYNFLRYSTIYNVNEFKDKTKDCVFYDDSFYHIDKFNRKSIVSVVINYDVRYLLYCDQKVLRENNYEK